MSDLFPFRKLHQLDVVNEMVITYLMDTRDQVEEYPGLWDDPINLWDSLNVVLSVLMTNEQMMEDSTRVVPLQWTEYVMANEVVEEWGDNI